MHKIFPICLIAFTCFSCKLDTKSVDGEKANVSIDDNGIEVNASEGNEKAEVRIGKDGIYVNADDGDEAANVTIDSDGIKINAEGTKVSIGEGGIRAGESKKKGRTYTIDGMNIKESIEIEDGDDVQVNGTAHDIKVAGTLHKLDVDGAKNTIYVDKVELIEIDGMGNKVFYRQKINGKEPRVSKDGLSNSVKLMEWRN